MLNSSHKASSREHTFGKNSNRSSSSEKGRNSAKRFREKKKLKMISLENKLTELQAQLKEESARKEILKAENIKLQKERSLCRAFLSHNVGQMSLQHTPDTTPHSLSGILNHLPTTTIDLLHDSSPEIDIFDDFEVNPELDGHGNDIYSARNNNIPKW